MASAEAWFNVAICPWKLQGSLGWTAQDGYLDSHTAPELCSLDGRLLGGNADGHLVMVTGGLC